MRRHATIGVFGLALLASFAACGEEDRVLGSSETSFSSELELRDASGIAAGSFPVGEPVTMVLRVHNRTETSQTLTLPTSQVFDFEVTDPAAASRAWHWSHDKLFATVLTELVFDAGETREFSVVWGQVDDTGASMPKGDYRAVGFVPSPEPGLRADEVRFAIR